MTGGMPSTAAVAASQQASDYQMSQMTDKIPELQQLAYSMYQDNGIEEKSKCEMGCGKYDDAGLPREERPSGKI